jgi:hypothetical protein
VTCGTAVAATTTWNTARHIQNYVEYRFDVCTATTWLHTDLLRVLLNFGSALLGIASHSLLHPECRGYFFYYSVLLGTNADKMRKTWENNKRMQHFTLET